ncbi:MAG: hypothetical protein ACR2PR_05265 [Pseudohongiellaceae bacterium]
MSISEAISIIVAILALVSSLCTGQRQVKLQKRVVGIEKSREQARITELLKANIRAELKKVDNRWRLILKNTGRCAARNLTIILDDKPLLQHVALKYSTHKEVHEIGPESDISYAMDIRRVCEPPFDFKATWDDDSDIKGSYNTTLTL